MSSCISTQLHLFMDAEIWNSYDFYMSSNIILFIFSSNHLKMYKTFLFWGPSKNRQWEGFGQWAVVCPPLILRVKLESLKIFYNPQHHWCSPHTQAHGAWKTSPLQAAWIHITFDLEGPVRIMYSYLLILHLRKLSLKEVDSHKQGHIAAKRFQRMGIIARLSGSSWQKRKGLRSDWIPRPHSGTLNFSSSIHPFISSFIHHSFLEMALVLGPMWGPGDLDIN